MKRSSIAAAALAALGLAVATQSAQASVYAQSSLQVEGLTITFSDPTAATLGTFVFTATNTAVLDGAATIQTATCGGTSAANTCSAISPVLNPLPANAPGSTVLRPDGSMIFFGPGAEQYANSDSQITTAQLVTGAPTATQQIAEAELQSGASASANAEIQSNTGFTFTFTLAAPGSLSLDFLADPDQLALINELLAGNYSAQTNLRAEFTLRQDTDVGGNGLLGFAAWTPQGTGAVNDCIAFNGVTCVETADSQDLNTALGVTTNGASVENSREAGTVLTPFGIFLSGLDAGTWTLSLNALTSVNLIRQVEVISEPGTLALLGATLLAMGFANRRQKKAEKTGSVEA